MKGLILLASYPKSGNTWLRAFLTNLIEERLEPASINALLPKYFASNRILLEKVSGLEVSELTNAELDHIRPQVYRFLAEKSAVPTYMKIHDINYEVPEEGNLVPLDIIDKVIYLVRNPLDIASSLAYHQNCSIDEAIDRMLDDNYVMGRTANFQPKIPEVLKSWSTHVTSWTSFKKVNAITLRYEDLLERPLDTFSSIVRFLDLDFSQSAILKAIELSSFKLLQSQEQNTTFTEKNPKAPYFFRQGSMDSWKKELSSAQVNKIVDGCKKVMTSFGYLPH